MRDNNNIPEDEAVIEYAEWIKPVPLDWLWWHKIPLGKLTLLVGDPTVGKGMFAIYVAAQITRGANWPDQPGIKEAPGSVIIMSTEDAWDDTIVPRLIASEADLSKVCNIKVQKHYSEDDYEHLSIYDLAANVHVLEKAVRRLEDVKLVILDPITAYMGKGKSGNSNEDVRVFCAPLTELANEYRFSILGISHLNKKPDVQAAYRTLGSIGWTATARAIWFVAKDTEDDEKRYLLPCGGNLGPKPTGLMYKVVEEVVYSNEGPIEIGKCVLEPDEVNITPDEVMAGKTVVSMKERAMEWIRDELKRGPVAAIEMKNKGETEGFHKKTLERAKRELGVKSYQVRESGKLNKWMWELGK